MVMDEPDECAMFAEYIETLNDDRLVAVTNSADRAIDNALTSAGLCYPGPGAAKGSGSGVSFPAALENMRSYYTPF